MSEREPDGEGATGGWTPEQLSAWLDYKQRKAVAFVERGYSVSWSRDPDNWMDVFVPERHHAQAPEVRASIKFFGSPSEYGIDGGMVSKLTIQRRTTDLLARVLGQPWERVETLFNYDRGPDIDRLREDATAHRIYHDVLEELN